MASRYELPRAGFVRLSFGLALTAVCSHTEASLAATPPTSGSSSTSEQLHYNNAFGQRYRQAWYDGERVYALPLGIATTRPGYKIAQQYTVVDARTFDNPTTIAALHLQLKKAVGLPIYDSVPGMAAYSPIWHNNWVLVPAGYKANTLRSVQDVVRSRYAIRTSNFWIN
jgi:hypothetical protein